MVLDDSRGFWRVLCPSVPRELGFYGCLRTLCTIVGRKQLLWDVLREDLMLLACRKKHRADLVFLNILTSKL